MCGLLSDRQGSAEGYSASYLQESIKITRIHHNFMQPEIFAGKCKKL
jgi:hypothetical protein